MYSKRTTARPRVYTTNEAVIERIREEIFASGITYKVLAQRTNRSATTIRKLASGDTRWPRPETLFPLMQALRLGLTIEKLK